MLTQIILAIPVLLPLIAATTYPLLESWSGSNFFNGFNHPPEAYDNTTNGDVFWATAQNTSLLYLSSGGTVILKVDNVSDVVYNEKRYAPKLLSKTTYRPGTVWVMDAVHLPYGCSVWPSFWTRGEIDILEGINQVTTNQVALHTEGGGCIASSSNSFSGTLTASNCSITANSGSGCTVNDTNTNSYGAGFAAAGGGVYVGEFTEDYIKVWFFTRSSVPSGFSATASSIDTSTLGTPVAEYDSSSCDIASYFGDQTLTIDITLCGDYAGLASLLEQTCGALVGTNTCYTTYVINDASTTYANAYYEINYVNAFSNSTTSASSSSRASGTSSATSTVTAGLGSSTSGASKSSTGAARPMRQWEEFGLRWIGLLLGGILTGVGLML